MLKKLVALLFTVLLGCSVSTSVFAQADSAKKARVEGPVVRSNKDNSTLTVRDRHNDTEKTVHYDSSTKWTSQYHNDKKVNDIEATEVKDGDQVICLGTFDDKGELHATMISKRLSHQ